MGSNILSSGLPNQVASLHKAVTPLGPTARDQPIDPCQVQALQWSEREFGRSSRVWRAMIGEPESP